MSHTFNRLSFTCHFYFSRIVRLWNHLPPMDLSLSYLVIKQKLRQTFWNHFLDNFNSQNVCSFILYVPVTITIVKSPLLLNIFWGRFPPPPPPPLFSPSCTIYWCESVSSVLSFLPTYIFNYCNYKVVNKIIKINTTVKIG